MSRHSGSANAAGSQPAKAAAGLPAAGQPSAPPAAGPTAGPPSRRPLPAAGNAPAPVAYWLVRNAIVGAVRLLFNPHIRRSGLEAAAEGPLIILSSHEAFPDPALVAMALPRRRLNFVVAATYFRIPVVGRVLRACGAIPKLQFRADMGAIKAMLRVLARGGVLGIFPEATRSLDGRPTPFDDSAARLVQRSGSAVVTVRIHGSYLSWPRWSSSGFRRGRIEAEARLLLTREESSTLPLAEIHRRICQALAYDEYEWQRQTGVPFHALRPALGLHRLLHRCPACDREKALDSDRRQLVCRFCGSGARMDRFGLLQPLTAESRIFADPAAWHVWQIERQYAQLADPAAVCCVSSPARALCTQGTGSFTPWGKGTLSLDRSGFHWLPDSGGQGTDRPERSFPLPTGGFSFSLGKYIELSSASATYRFCFSDDQEAIRFADQVAALVAIRPSAGGTSATGAAAGAPRPLAALDNPVADADNKP